MDPPTGLDTTSLRHVVAVLCVTQIISWGVLTYTLPVLAPTIAEETGWSLTSVVAAFTWSQLVAAGFSIVVGRAIDSHGPRHVMTGGAIVGVAGLVGIASAPDLVTFTIAWAVVGASMSAVLYPPAFAAVTEWGGPHRVRALTALTLVGGFASTVFAPLAAFLVGPLGWRNTYLVLAALLVLTVPLLWWALRHPWRPHRHVDGRTPDPAAERRAEYASTLRTRRFIGLVAALTLTGFAQRAVVFLLVPLVVERGLSIQAAAFALGGVGVGQVCGRLGYAPLAARYDIGGRTRIVFVAVAGTTLALAVVPGPAAVLFALAFASGIARGAYTLIQATAVADRWGTAAYASLNGVISAVLLVAGAFAPWIGTALAGGVGGYAPVFAVLAAIGAVGVIVSPRA